MSKQVLTDALIAFDGRAFRDTANQVAIEYGAEALDGTTFADDTRINEGGLLTAAMSAEGFFRAPNPDKALFDQMGAKDKVITIAPTPTEGNIAYSLQAVLGNYSPNGEIGQLLAFSMSAGARDRLVRGTLLANKETISATGSGTAFQVGAATSGQTIYAALHVVNAGGTTPTLDVTVESDDAEAMSSATTRITFDQATDLGSQFKTLAGPVTDDWWRVSYTVGGTSPDFDFIVVLGILTDR